MRIIKLDLEILRFVFSTDWHLTDQPPGRRGAGYREEIMAKVEFHRDLTQKLKAVGLCGADIFHSKGPKAAGNTFSLLTRLEDTLRGFYLNTLFSTIGNHDLYMDRMDSIPNQPIGPLIASGAITNITAGHAPEGPGSIIFENNDGSVRVQVDAYPYADDMVTLQRVLNAPPREEGVNHRIVLMHQYGNPGDQGSLFGHPTIGYNQMAECDYDFALWGHDHSRAETMTVGNCTHVRLGSLARASLAMDEVDRPVALAVLSFKGDKVGFKEVEVPVKPLEIAFTAANKEVERVQQSEEVLEFFKEMDTAVGEVSSEDPREILRQLCPVDEPKLFDLVTDLCGL